MNRLSALLGRPLVIAAILATPLAAAPAAADEALVLGLSIDDEITLHPGAGSAAATLLLRPNRAAGLTAEVKVVVDLAPFAGKVTMRGEHCSAAGTVYTCSFRVTMTPGSALPIALTEITYTAAADAAPASKRVVWRMTSDVAAPAEAGQYVTVQDTGNLIGEGDRDEFHRTGERVAVPPLVRNTGGGEVRGAALSFAAPPTFDAVDLPSNCRSRDDETSVEYRCVFAGALAAGADYRLSRAVELLIADDTPAAASLPDAYRLGYEWTPSGSALTDGEWRPGTGPAVALAPATETPRGGSSGSVFVVVSTVDAYDLAVTASPVTGRPGGRAEVVFTIANRGKTVVGPGDRVPRLLDVAYTPPEGFTPVGGCRAHGEGPLKGMCAAGAVSPRWLRAGASMRVTVVFTVGGKPPGSKGTAVIAHQVRHDGELRVERWSDARPADDTASFGPRREHAEAPLARTGTPVPVLAGTAGALGAVGAAALVLGRRRA